MQNKKDSRISLFILDVCKPLKKKLKIFYVGPRRYSHLSVLESHGQARINLKFFGDITLPFSAFDLSCFTTKKDNGNFPLLYVVKMSLRRWVGGSKKPQNSLT